MKIYSFHLRNLFLFLLFVLLIVFFLQIIFSPLRNAEDDVQVTAGENKLVFILDPGHGGFDSGAVFDTIAEKDLNLQIALSLGSILSENGYTVVYTRNEDRELCTLDDRKAGLGKINDLKNRVKTSTNYINPIFISIHMNSFGDSRYSGLQVFYSTNNEESQKLARSIQKEIKNSLQKTNNRAVKQGKDIYVLENSCCPSVLIECGFMSNPEELYNLCEKEYQKQLSFSIFCGIIEYMK